MSNGNYQRPVQDMLSAALNPVSLNSVSSRLVVADIPKKNSNNTNLCDDDNEPLELDILMGDTDGEAPPASRFSYTSGGRRIDGSVMVPKESNLFLANQLKRYDQGLQRNNGSSIGTNTGRPITNTSFSSSSAQRITTNRYLHHHGKACALGF